MTSLHLQNLQNHELKVKLKPNYFFLLVSVLHVVASNDYFIGFVFLWLAQPADSLRSTAGGFVGNVRQRNRQRG